MDRSRLSLVLPVLALALAPGALQASTGTALPAPLDEEAFLIERYWEWLKAETGAPDDLPWPRIDIEPLPRTVRMAFTFPTEEAPWRELRIVLSPQSVDRAAGPQRLEVVGELAHEMVHYVMVLGENGWNPSAETLRNDVHHHCDPGFMRLTAEIGRFLWDTYHSSDALRAVDFMVNSACWRDGHTISVTRNRWQPGDISAAPQAPER